MAPKKTLEIKGSSALDGYMTASGEEKIKLWLAIRPGNGVAGVPNPEVRPKPAQPSHKTLLFTPQPNTHTNDGQRPPDSPFTPP